MNASDYLYEDETPPFVDEAPSWRATLELVAVFVLCLLTILVSLGACLSLAVTNRRVLDFYILSLCVADLVESVVVLPLSLVATFDHGSDGGHTACAVSGYLNVSLCAVRMYTFMWIAVDRYLAVRKPLRYDIIQTRVRCQCWVFFSWVTATCACSPPLLGESSGHFYYEGFLCVLDVGSMLPYSITVGCLVVIPSLLTMLYCYACIFICPSEDSVKEAGGRKISNQIVTFMITVEFLLLWLPKWLTSVVEHATETSIAGPVLNFWLLFLGESYMLWNPFTVLLLYPRCYDGFLAVWFKTPVEMRV